MKSYILNDDSADWAALLDCCYKQLACPGAVLLLPTETVYGLVCRWDDESGRERIRRMKGRDAGKPFQMLVADIGMALREGLVPDERITDVCRRFCPGPLTIVAQAGEGTVGFRIPDHAFVLALLAEVGPLAATSANLAGEPPALSPAEALAVLPEMPDLLVDGGALLPGSPASTVIDLSAEEWRILRHGPLSEDALRACLDKL